MWQGIKNVYHFGVAFMANVWFGWPTRKLTVIGVTGTDGKTTTVNLIYHILKSTGKNVSMISSIGAIIGGNQYDVGFHVTTPSSFALQRFIKKTLISKTEILVLEVTSHALDQYRVLGIPFAVGVLTNVTHEHLDYHKKFEKYVKTKAKLLQLAKIGILNRDDESYEIISKLKFETKKLITYGMDKNADVNPQTFPFETKLLGLFNKYNILAAIAATKVLGVSDESIKNAVQSFKLPIGRAEIVYQDDFTVMIDFAHTPNALEQILSSLSEEVSGQIIHVFGSAGKRDFSKRPKMGMVSDKYADIIVLTSEDPRGESVEKIMEEIASGIQNPERTQKGTLFKIADRQKAISEAIRMAKKGDLVLITGKSHEKSMNYGKGEVPWSEHEAVAQALKFKNL